MKVKLSVSALVISMCFIMYLKQVKISPDGHRTTLLASQSVGKNLANKSSLPLPSNSYPSERVLSERSKPVLESAISQDLADDGFTKEDLDSLSKMLLEHPDQALDLLRENYQKSFKSAHFWASEIGLTLLASDQNQEESILWLEKSFQLGSTDPRALEEIMHVLFKTAQTDRIESLIHSLAESELESIARGKYAFLKGDPSASQAIFATIADEKLDERSLQVKYAHADTPQ